MEMHVIPEYFLIFFIGFEQNPYLYELICSKKLDADTKYLSHPPYMFYHCTPRAKRPDSVFTECL